MQKLRDGKPCFLPYFELTIKPADTRPIILSMCEPTGSIQISPGTADDMAEVLGVLGMMRQVVASALNVRLMSEAHEIKVKEIIVQADEDLPF